MLEKIQTLKGYQLSSLDGELGSVKEFYFDDQHWTIRYLVAETGHWLSGRQVLISPYALTGVNTEKKTLSVQLTKKQIEDSPSLATDQPVSRHFEENYFDYYQYPAYWAGAYSWGVYPFFIQDRQLRTKPVRRVPVWDYHLRSSQDVTGHHVEALDGEIGHVADFILDVDTWTLRYLVIDTTNWWPGKKVLVSPHWIENINWGLSKVFVNLSRKSIQNSPGFDEVSALDRDYESELYGHYSRQGYWVDELAAKSDHKASSLQSKDGHVEHEIKNG